MSLRALPCAAITASSPFCCPAGNVFGSGRAAPCATERSSCAWLRSRRSGPLRSPCPTCKWQALTGSAAAEPFWHSLMKSSAQAIDDKPRTSTDAAAPRAGHETRPDIERLLQDDHADVNEAPCAVLSEERRQRKSPAFRRGLLGSPRFLFAGNSQCRRLGSSANRLVDHRFTAACADLLAQQRAGGRKRHVDGGVAHLLGGGHLGLAMRSSACCSRSATAVSRFSRGPCLHALGFLAGLLEDGRLPRSPPGPACARILPGLSASSRRRWASPERLGDVGRPLVEQGGDAPHRALPARAKNRTNATRPRRPGSEKMPP